MARDEMPDLQDQNIHDPHEYTVSVSESELQHALRQDDAKVVECFFHEGSDRSANDFVGINTPLMLACNFHSVNCTRVLVQEFGADVNLGDDGRTPLSIIMEKAYDDKDEKAAKMLEVLIPAGADVNVHDGKNTPLEYALKYSADKCFHMLVEAGAKTETVNKNGESLLQLALRSRASDQMIMGLLKAGCDVNAKDPDGDVVFATAVEKGYGFPVLKAILDAGCDVKYKDVDGNNLLHAVLRNEEPKVVEDIIKDLIERGVDVKAVDGVGNSPLHLALGNRGEASVMGEPIKGFSLETIKALLDAGADPNIRARSSGETALQVAIRCKAPDDVVKLLILNTKVNSEDKEGKTAVHSAIIEKRSLDVIEDLLRAGARLELDDEPVADILKDDEYLVESITQMKAKFRQMSQAAIVMGVGGEGDGQVGRGQGLLDEEEEAEDLPIHSQTEEQAFKEILECHNLTEFYPVFEEEAITLQEFVKLRDEDFKTLGFNDQDVVQRMKESAKTAVDLAMAPRVSDRYGKFTDADIFKSADNWQQTLADMADTLTGERNPKSLKNLLSEPDVGEGTSSYELGSHLVRPENLVDALDVLEAKLDGCVGDLTHFKEKYQEVNPEVRPAFDSNFAMALLNDKIYAVGGWNGSQILKTGEVYDHEKDSWSEIASMNEPRWSFALIAYNNKLYAIGGYQIKTVEIYDPTINEWKFMDVRKDIEIGEVVAALI